MVGLEARLSEYSFPALILGLERTLYQTIFNIQLSAIGLRARDLFKTIWFTSDKPTFLNKNSPVLHTNTCNCLSRVIKLDLSLTDVILHFHKITFNQSLPQLFSRNQNDDNIYSEMFCNRCKRNRNVSYKLLIVTRKQNAGYKLFTTAE